MRSITQAAPLPTQFSWRTAYFAMSIARAAYSADVSDIESVLRSEYGLLAYRNLPPTDDAFNRVCICSFPGINFVGIEGTARTQQWLNYTRHMDLTFEPDGSGIATVFKSLALDVLAKLLDHLPRNVPTILCGHSLGGAVASVIPKFVAGGLRVDAVWTFGAPKPGNQRFADLYRTPNFRVFNGADAVPLLPPLGIFASIFDPFNAVKILQAVHVGEAAEIGEHRFLTSTFQFLLETMRNGYPNGLPGFASTHFIRVYLDFLEDKLDATDREAVAPLHRVWADRNGVLPDEILFRSATPQEYRANAIQTEGEETAALQSVVADQGSVLFELFTTDSVLGENPLYGDFRKAAFPGYAPLPIPAGVAIARDAAGLTSTERFVLRFTAADDVPTPLTVAGVFAHTKTPTNARELLGFQTFRPAISIAKAGDFVEAPVSVNCTRVA